MMTGLITNRVCRIFASHSELAISIVPPSCEVTTWNADIADEARKQGEQVPKSTVKGMNEKQLSNIDGKNLLVKHRLSAGTLCLHCCFGSTWSFRSKVIAYKHDKYGSISISSQP